MSADWDRPECCWDQNACASRDADSVSMGAATFGDFGTSEAECRGTETQFSQFTTQH